MKSSNIIQVFEYGTLKVSDEADAKFRDVHFRSLARYLTENSKCGYYELLYNRVRFKNYVGVIKVGDLTIEVLPKCDRYDSVDEFTWQHVLIEMLAISIQVEAKTSTHADVNIRKHSVLETYLTLFLNEIAILIHHGLVKKYSKNENNQNALKGKLLIHKHVTKNIVHAERFYVSHQVYDCDNIYNSILFQTLQCIRSMNVTMSITRRCQSLLLDFPECSPVQVNEKLFKRLNYDRKTEGYKTAISLARIILLNYHPDVKSGRNDILAIMFDMNLLWENYIYYMLKKSCHDAFIVKSQRKKFFWKPADGSRVTLIPDIIIGKNGNEDSTIVLDTKWKYQSSVSSQDLRQMYTYGNYFNANRSYLVYPDKIDVSDSLKLKEGCFVDPEKSEKSTEQICGLLYVDLLKRTGERKSILNKEIGAEILKRLFL